MFLGTHPMREHKILLWSWAQVACSTMRASKIKAIPCMLWPLEVGPHPTGTYKRQQPIQMGTDFSTCWSILEVGITTLPLRKLRALIIKNYYDWIFFVNKTIGSFAYCVWSRRHWESLFGDLWENLLMYQIYKPVTWNKWDYYGSVSSFITIQKQRWICICKWNISLCSKNSHKFWNKQTHFNSIGKRLQLFLEARA